MPCPPPSRLPRTSSGASSGASSRIRCSACRTRIPLIVLTGFLLFSSGETSPAETTNQSPQAAIVSADTLATNERICLFGAVGSDGLALIGIDRTLYLLGPDQGFWLPDGRFGRLFRTPAGSLMVIAGRDSICVSTCEGSAQGWSWASPFQNPQQGHAPTPDLSRQIKRESQKERAVVESGREQAFERQTESPRPSEEEDAAPPGQTKVAPPSTSMRIVPRPPVIQILGIKHTAMATLWYEGDQHIQGVHLLLEPTSSAAALLSVETDPSVPEPVSLTYAHSPHGGLQIRLVSDGPLTESPQLGALFNLLLESREPGSVLIRMKKITVSTGQDLWSLPDDSLTVYIENE